MKSDDDDDDGAKALRRTPRLVVGLSCILQVRR